MIVQKLRAHVSIEEIREINQLKFQIRSVTTSMTKKTVSLLIGHTSYIICVFYFASVWMHLTETSLMWFSSVQHIRCKLDYLSVQSFLIIIVNFYKNLLIFFSKCYTNVVVSSIRNYFTYVYKYQ